MKNKLTIPIILGTARKSCSSNDVLAFVSSYLASAQEDISFPMVPTKDYLFSKTYEAWNEHEEVPEINEWRQLAEKADGYIIITPEYNHGYPGELKILLDAAFQEYFDKPVMLVGVSSGPFGGTRVVENIKPVLIELGMKPTGHAIYFSNVSDYFTEDREITPEARETYEKRIDRALEPLLSYAWQLRTIRD